jgi:type I restriction enzyme S subunit
MSSFQHGFEFCPIEGGISPDYTLLRPTFDKEIGRFLKYSLKSDLLIQQLTIFRTGIRQGQRLQWNRVRYVKIPVPDVDGASAVADFLDQETARIDQLVQKKERLLVAASQRIEALVHHAISDPNIPRIRIEHAMQRMHRPVDLTEHDQLVRLGLYNRGRGIFKKPAADEDGMGASDFHFVKAGDLILSGQFAWEGSVALAADTEEGCVVSHRYPVYRGRLGINTAYLLGLFRSNFGDFLLNDSSRGSAGRNRPLNTWRLGKEKIPFPNAELQSDIQRAVHFETRLRTKIQESIARLEELRNALITAAVTGQLDVKTWTQRERVECRPNETESENSRKEATA